MSPGGRGGNGSPAPPMLSFNSFVKVLLAVAEDISLPPCAEPRDPRDPTAAIVLKVTSPIYRPISSHSSALSSPYLIAASFSRYL